MTSRRYKLFDDHGLYLLIAPSGGKWWRFRYRYAGKERHLSLGTYPRVKLKEARERRKDAETKLVNGVDPGAKPPLVVEDETTDTFKQVSYEWLQTQKAALAETTWKLAQRRLELWVLPAIGNHVISEISPPLVLRLLRKIESKGKYHTAHRVRQRLGQIFRYAIVTGRLDRDPTADLKGALTVATSHQRSALTTPDEASRLLNVMGNYGGQPATVAALHVLALTFVRPGELRQSTWDEFDLIEGVWRIPGRRMKMGRDHVVPVARQTKEWLIWLQEIGVKGRYVFGATNSNQPIGTNTINNALRSMGYGGEIMTAHGFRAMASTLLHELGWPPEVIELQLAHAQRNQVAAAYNRSARLAERSNMMQAWADYLDALVAGKNNVVALHSR